MPKLRPLFENIIIERQEEDSVSPGGIFLPDNSREKPSKGRVLSIGKGVGDEVIRENDFVIFSRYSGTEVTVDDESFLVMSVRDVLAVVDSQ